MRQGADLQQDLITGDTDFTDPRIRTAFEELLQLHKGGYFGKLMKQALHYANVEEGIYPLYFIGSWFPSNVKAAGGDPKDYTFFPLPRVKGIVHSTDALMIPTYTKHKEAARKLVKFLASADAQKVWAKAGGFISPNLDVPLDVYKLPSMGKCARAAGKVTVVGDLDDALGSPFQSAFWGQLQAFWSNPSKSTIDEVLVKLQAKQC